MSSDATGRLHVHLHSRSVLKLWKDEQWAALSSESLIKSDTVFEAELLDLARPKPSHDNFKGDEEDGFDDVLTVRKAMQLLEDGPDRKGWNDKGLKRILDLAAGTANFGQRGSKSASFSGGILR